MLVRTFGEVIRERRHILNLTQQQVAGRIGVSTPFVGHLELCKRRPSHHTVQLLADVLGLDQSELFLTANPEAAELLRWRRQPSSAWDQFRQTYAAEVEPPEIELLSKVATMGPVRSPRDFLYILNSVRQVLGRDLIDLVAKRDEVSSSMALSLSESIASHRGRLQPSMAHDDAAGFPADARLAIHRH